MIKEEKYKKILQLAKQTNWKEAVENELKKEHPLRYERLVYNAAADWIYLIPLPEEAVILDAGCGWGTITFQLAKHCKEIYALDNSPMAVEFIKIRAQQDKVGNVFPIEGDVYKLPFSDGHFDLVVLNGILEWIGPADNSKNAKEVQEIFLKEIYRVLKKEGYLYLAIENRWSATYMLGAPEGHVNLRFVSLLPRWLGRLYHRLRKHSEYRVFTHSLKNYLLMLKKAGFKKISSYTPIPQYQKFSYLISLEYPSLIRYYLKNLFDHKKKLAIWLADIVMYLRFYKPAKYFPPSYSFVAAKNSGDKLFYDFGKEIDCALSAEKLKEYGQLYYILRSGIGHVVLFAFNKSGEYPVYIIKIARDPDNNTLGKEYSSLKILSEIGSNNKFIRNSVPDVIYYGKPGKYKILVENTMQGISMEKTIRNKTSPFWKINLRRDVFSVVDWLIEFQRMTLGENTILEGKNLEKYFSVIYAGIEKNKSSLINSNYVIKKLQELEKKVSGNSIPFAMQHRDFGPSNIYINDGKIKVIDWEISKSSGESLYDLFYFTSNYFFFVYYNASIDKTADFKTQAKFKKQIYFSGQGYIHKLISEVFSRYCQIMKIDHDVLKLMFLWFEIDKFENVEILNIFFANENNFIMNDQKKEVLNRGYQTP